ncbi:MAG: N-formylglutamate amidohydrolase [Planctomycetes bacterium]|nr:N-formylglutamate amidohydrolase [Planctomycetota bacterium]
MVRARTRAPLCLVLSCEHGGNRVPARYRRAFDAPATVLASHRGWDPGALPLARRLARALRAPLFATTVTRLLVDCNRSPHHRSLHSPFARLDAEARLAVLAEHYEPHRTRVESAIAERIAEGARVLHVAVHSFTPVLDGVERNADIGWLYDPRRASELRIVDTLRRELERNAPALRVRRNYPYLGRTDGFPTALRRRFDERSYAGLELELNQLHARRPPFAALVAALRSVLAEG